MRIGTFNIDGRARLGVISDEGVQYLNDSEGWPANMVEWISASEEMEERYSNLKDSIDISPIDNSSLIAPIPKLIGNVMCLGKNYAAHAEETAGEGSSVSVETGYPLVFTKGTNTINGPYGKIPYDPSVSSQIDWEVELAVIIGRECINVDARNALSNVFGYTVLNDISARDIQYRHKQFYLGKSLNGSCPMGPWIVTSDEIDNPQCLDIKCWVNNDLMQESNTSDQIYSVAETISIFSKGHTLFPGDVIATGTPAGVGFVRKPPRFLVPGDVLESEVQGIGRMRNVVGD
ncbi:MAG: 5-carboxymethyl-2-hydroxymuconate isomerase [Chloroflexi bacterium]|nr:5-carboxymethyl-2-hydroxymuconate isomerase [Chloroflexota bacterium]HCU79817.1 5-carboxymethyl-2-hydroxymuconate isomerase [Chloroflexota bacterium]|tara:strand:+ start:1879 stop:2748 length:870 start_codon:yes stop_codon:yes gene_type:complete